MAEQFKQKIHELLKSTLFTDVDDAVDVSDGDDQDLHIVVFSRKFADLRPKEKQAMILKVLQQHLTPEEWGQITLIVGVSPEQAKMYT